MNIREVELRTGLERANIRYYEKEGLLSPSRLPNGYRDYSETDVETLLRIKLLRELEVSVAEIAQLQTSEVALQDVISTRLELLQQERAALARERKVCETIQADGQEYERLEAERYLKQLENLRRQDWGVDPAESWSGTAEHFKGDVAPLDLRPGQRLLARILNRIFYYVLWLFLYYIVFQTEFSWSRGVLWNHLLAPFLVQIFVEPTMISFLGGTLGHFVIGMRVHTYQGTRLTWWEAMGRMWLIFWKVPLLLSRRSLWQSHWREEWYGDYWPLNKDNGFPWDEMTAYSFRDESVWRIPAVVGCMVAMVLSASLMLSEAQELKNSGPMTVAQFAENYNEYVNGQRDGDEYMLDDQGQWYENSTETHYVYMDGGAGSHETRFPTMTYTVEEGILTGLSFTIERKETDGKWISTGRRAMVDVTIAFAAPDHQSKDIIEEEIVQHCMEDYTMQIGDKIISWQVDYQGYAYSEGLGTLIPSGHDSREPYYCLHFEITTEEHSIGK